MIIATKSKETAIMDYYSKVKTKQKHLGCKIGKISVIVVEPMID